MKKVILLLLPLIIVVLTGCPKSVTKPNLKINKNGIPDQTTAVGKINLYLANAQLRYNCYKIGRLPGITDIERDRPKTTSTTKKASSSGGLTCSDTSALIVQNDGSASFREGTRLAKIERDEAIEDAMAIVDSNYETFIDNLNNGRSTANFVADVIDLGTSAAIGITKGERPLQILGVALTAYRGGRKSADLNFFKEQSTPVLINKMDDNRSRQQLLILKKKQLGIDNYSLKEAIRDTVSYYNAGTLVRAFSELSKDTAAQANRSNKEVQEITDKKIIDFPSKEQIDLSDSLRKEKLSLIAKYIKVKDSAVDSADRKAFLEDLKVIWFSLNEPKFQPFLSNLKKEPEFADFFEKNKDGKFTNVTEEELLEVINGFGSEITDNPKDYKLAVEFLEILKKVSQ